MCNFFTPFASNLLSLLEQQNSGAGRFIIFMFLLKQQLRRKELK
jgi:hypothetical protein